MRTKRLMKTIVYHNSGSGDVLKLEEIEKPVPEDDQVLIKLCAASVNPLDYQLLRHAFLRRVMSARSKVKIVGPGRDVAGVISREVEAVGRNVTQSSQATRCSARALERLPSMRAHARQHWQ